MRRLQLYTNWEYDYVYGEYGDLYDMLVNGEIDLLTGLAYKEERTEILSYPDLAMGDTPYVFLKRIEDSSITDDPDSIAGKKIGVVEGAMSGIVDEYLEKYGIDATQVVFNDLKERDAALLSGDVDITIVEGNGTGAMEGVEAFEEAGASDYFVVVNKSPPDILEDLNAAQAALFTASPKIKTELNDKWFRQNAVSTTLTANERTWLNDHPTFRVGYYATYLPYSATDENGNVTGVVRDVVPEIFTSLGVKDQKIEFQGYESYDDMALAIENGDVDAIFPVYANYWATEQYEVTPTDSVISTYYDLIYKGDYPNLETATFAIRKSNSLAHSFLTVTYPQNQVLEYDSVEDCLDAVKSGEVDATIINGLRSDYYLRGNDRYYMLQASQIPNDVPLGFSASLKDAGTIEILNHGISLLPTDFTLTNSYQYEQRHRVTVREFLRDNNWIAAAIIFAVAAVAIWMIERELQKNKEPIALKEEQRKALEKAKDAAEAANNAKTTFLFNMSHDIRTPMNAIMGFRDLLEKNQEDPEKRSYYLRQIEEASTVLLSIINNVLEMARIEKGTLELDSVVWSAEQFNDTIYSVFHTAMTEKGIDFERTIQVDHPYVYCDPGKLREVFLNILSNAYKYTNAGGKVTMLLEELPSKKEGEALYRTTIADTGIGMSEDFLPHIFEEFSRERTSTQSRVEGTGLGMPIVKRLVDFMGGTIEVQSTKGVGTTFIVTIPHRIAEKKDLIDHSKVSVNKQLFEGKRVLLAEDIEVNAEIAKAILTDVGFTVDVAQDGQICVDMLDQAADGYYNVVLMDIQMPIMNGYEATSAIRALADPGKAQIPILAMTANAFEEDKREAIHAGMNGHVAKPVDVPALMKELTRVLSA